MRKTLLAAALACLSTSALADPITFGISLDNGPISTVFNNVPNGGLVNVTIGPWALNLRESGSTTIPTFGYEINNFTTTPVPSTLNIYETVQNNLQDPLDNTLFASYDTHVLTPGWVLEEQLFINPANGVFGGSLVDFALFTSTGVINHATPLAFPTGLYSMTAQFTLVSSDQLGEGYGDINVIGGHPVSVPGPVAGEGAVGITACLLMLFLAWRRRHDKFRGAASA